MSIKIRIEAYKLRKGFYEVALYLPYPISPGKFFYTEEKINEGAYVYIFRVPATSKKNAIYKIVRLYLR